jgi:hypothetical protein
LTLAEFDYMALGHQQRQERAHESRIDNWRQTRLLATILINTNRGPNTLAISPQDLFELPGDPPPAPPMSEEDFDNTMARLAEFDTLKPAA